MVRRLVFLAPVAALVTAACLGAGAGDGDSATPPTDEAGSTEKPTVVGIPPVVGWATDWTKSSIDLRELILGLRAPDPRDLISPLDAPTFETVEEASQWLADREPVLRLELAGEVRAYPLQILTRHEIANDQVGDIPIAVTYCPLCNSALVFERTVDGRVLRFGVSGLLRKSDLVMWDRQTESLWQQITGEAIVGELTGTQLEFVPSSIIRWSEFKESFPDGQVLSRNTGFPLAYYNPYVGYDQGRMGAFLFDGEIDERFPAFERVVGLRVGDTTKAYPFSTISGERAVNDDVAGQPVLVLWGAEDTASALDSSDIAEGRSVGVGVAYLRTMEGQLLTFKANGGDTFVDLETGTTWDLLGRAIAGPLEGKQLTAAVHTNELWFAWAAFNPNSPVYGDETANT